METGNKSIKNVTSVMNENNRIPNNILERRCIESLLFEELNLS